VATLSKWLEFEAPPFVAGDVFVIGFEPGRGGVVEDQVDIQFEQIGTVPEDFLLNRIAMLGQKIHGAVELIEPKILALRQPGPIEPALMAG